MKKTLKISRLYLLLFALMFLFMGSGLKVEAAKKKVTTVVYNQSTNMLDVQYNGAVICSAPYQQERVYASTDIISFRRGPGKQFTQIKSMKLDVGEAMIKMGSIPNSIWSIVYVNGKICFVNNYYLTYTQPVNMLTEKRYTARQLKWKGVIHWHGWRFTWYSQKVLRGRRLRIPGRHVDKHGYICDKDGYICLASGKLRKGTVVNTPFGKKGKVYDSGCGRGTLDVYTNF